MRPYSPGGALNALASALQGSIPATPSAQSLRRGLPGYLILFAPHAFASQRQYRSRKPPSPPVFLPISNFSPLHREFRFPLPYSSQAVSNALPWLSQGISHLTYKAAYTLFTPNNSEQRSHPPYYRGCWHGVSRCFLWRYRQSSGLFTLKTFFPPDRALRPEGLHHSRGVAASGLPPLRKIPHCCLP